MSQDALFTHPKPNPKRVAKTHEIRRIEVAHDSGLSFGLPVLQGMATAVPTTHVPHEHGRPEPLALFGFAADPGAPQSPRLLVCAQTLEWEVDPLEWLRWLWIKEGWIVGLAQTHPGPGGPRYELAALKTIDGTVMVRRTIAIRSGPRLVRCDASAPMEVWGQWHDALWWSLDGFHLGRVVPGSIESLVVREGPLLGFAIPGSWDARGHGSDEEGMAWALQPVRDVQRGAAIKVHAQRLDGAPLAELRRASLWREMRDSGAAMGAVLTAKREDFVRFVPGWLGQWQAAVAMSKGDGVVVLVQREDAGVALDYVLTAPAAGTDHVDWMRATRALDVVISTSLPMPSRAAV